MRADTVAEAVAAYYGVSKSELLDAGAADLPVRMALGEAKVRGSVGKCIYRLSNHCVELPVCVAPEGTKAPIGGVTAEGFRPSPPQNN